MNMDIILGMGVLMGGVIMGLGIIAAGETLLAIREVALNTRQAVIPQGLDTYSSHYPVLGFVAGLNKVLGWVVVVVGSGAAVAVWVVPGFGRSLGSLFWPQ